MARDKLTLHSVPSFCGGRIITGFFQWQKADRKDFVFEFSKTVGGHTARTGNFGVLYAITNGEQTQGAAFLEEIGFKAAIKTSKYNNSDVCTTWIGDWFNDVQPKLKAIIDEYEKEQAVKMQGSRLRHTSAPESTVAETFNVGDRFVFLRDNSQGGPVFGKEGEVGVITWADGNQHTVEFSSATRQVNIYARTVDIKKLPAIAPTANVEKIVVKPTRPRVVKKKANLG